MNSLVNKYLIDGYNFLFRIKNKGFSSLEKNRKDLLALLDENLFSLQLPVSIIFDGCDPVRAYAQRTHFNSLEVIYTSDQQSADEYLIEMLQQAKHPMHHTVITSDRELARACRLLGAKTLSVEAFLRLIEEQQKKMQKPLSKPSLRFSPRELHRLLVIFEKRLKE